MASAELDALQQVSTRTTPELIANQIRSLIVDGKLAPGTQLVEAQLSERLGVSRGPVREAMQRLIQEGLLVNTRNRGVFVIELGPDDVADIYTARHAIERHAAAHLCRRRDAEALDALDATVTKMAVQADHGRWDRLAALDLVFHETLVAATGSRRLSTMFATLAAETRICLANLVESYPRPHDLVDEHRQLATLLRNGTQRQVLAAVDDHLATAVRALTQPGTPAPS